MKSVMLAAVVVQLTAAGGAGAGSHAQGRQAAERNGASQPTPSIKESFSALKKEVDSLRHDYAEARERERREAERKKREAEVPYVAPQKRAP